MNRLAVVITAYVSAYPDPLVVEAGDVLRLEREDDEFPGWLWCRAANGAAGWVPQTYLLRLGTTVHMIRDYEATELTVQAGERLAVLEEVLGWCWCENASGNYGWVPAAALRLETG